MSFRGRRSLAGNRRAAFRFSWLLIALLPLAGLTPAAETPAKGDRDFPAFAPERDPEAENRPVFGPRKGADKAGEAAPAARPRMSFAPRGREAAPKDGAAVVKPPKNPFWSFVPVLLLVVCLGCWFVVMLLKRWGIGGKSLFNSPALEVLGRAQIDRGKYIALVRAGKRVLVVGVNPNGFDALGEITDPAEAAEVMMEARPQTRAGKNVFRDLFMQHIGGGKAEWAVMPQTYETVTALDVLPGSLTEE